MNSESKNPTWEKSYLEIYQHVNLKWTSHIIIQLFMCKADQRNSELFKYHNLFSVFDIDDEHDSPCQIMNTFQQSDVAKCILEMINYTATKHENFHEYAERFLTKNMLTGLSNKWARQCWIICLSYLPESRKVNHVSSQLLFSKR